MKVNLIEMLLCAKLAQSDLKIGLDTPALSRDKISGAIAEAKFYRETASKAFLEIACAAALIASFCQILTSEMGGAELTLNVIGASMVALICTAIASLSVDWAISRSSNYKVEINGEVKRLSDAESIEKLLSETAHYENVENMSRLSSTANAFIKQIQNEVRGITNAEVAVLRKMVKVDRDLSSKEALGFEI